MSDLKFSKEALNSAKPGQKFAVKFGRHEAQLCCMERITSPTLFLRFSLYVLGVEVAELSAEKFEGVWNMEQLA